VPNRMSFAQHTYRRRCGWTIQANYFSCLVGGDNCGPGSLDSHRSAASCAYYQEIAMTHLREVFKRIDADGSGEISINEMQHFLTGLLTKVGTLRLEWYTSHAKRLFKYIKGHLSAADLTVTRKLVQHSMSVHCLSRATLPHAGRTDSWCRPPK